MRVEEGVEQLYRYLDSAFLARLPFVRIIHGKGTGVLRRIVRDELRRHPLVKESHSGELNEGGDGVTIVKFIRNQDG